jgi:hypothetical protein
MTRLRVGLSIGSALLALACSQAVRAPVASTPCSDASTVPDALLQTAVNAIAGASGRGAGRVRDIAAVTPVADSIRSHAELVTDQTSCRAAGQTAQVWSAGDRYEVVRIGRTYWVRGTSWHYVNVVDDRFQLIQTIADAN